MQNRYQTETAVKRLRETLQNTPKVLLPFISTQLQNKKVDDTVEKAAVFCITELDRQKGGGLFRKQEPEKIVYVAEAYYPFWVVPFRNLTLLFDGLNLASHTMSYHSFPDTKTFSDDLSQNSSSRQAYASFLENHVNYFQAANGEQSTVVEGLITDLDFLAEFLEFTKEAVTINTPVDGVLISPAQDKKQVQENIQKLENLHLKLEQELAQLNEIIKVLNQQTQQALAALRQEIKETEDRFSPEVEKTKTAVERKKAKINQEYSDKVKEVSDQFETELVAKRAEIINLQKTNEQRNSDIATAENEIKSALVNKDEDAEQKWKEKRNELKKQIPETASAIKDLEAKVREVEENKKNTLFQLNQENDARLKDANKDVTAVESARDAEIKTCQEEMEKIEDLTATIIGKIDQLTKISETTITEFDKLGVQKETTESQLVHMPFYLTCYQSGPNKRCTCLPPSIQSNGSISVRLKGLGKSKITQLFQPRSQKLVSKLNSFLGLLAENIAFSHEIQEAGSKASLLGSKEKVDLIRNGLTQLKTNGWLSDSEFEFFNKALP